MNNIYHGILLDAEFVDSNYPNKYKIFYQRRSRRDRWLLIGIEVPASELEKTIADIQLEMKEGLYYAHLYNNEELIVIFKNKLFRITPSIATWTEAIKYGQGLGIPDKQLDFFPNRFQDEKHGFID